MDKDLLKQFIDERLYVDTPADTVEMLIDDVDELEPVDFVDKWAPTLEQYSEGWSEFANKNIKSLPEQLRESFGTSDTKNPFRRPKNFVDEIYNTKYKDKVSRAKFDSAIDKMAEYWDIDKNARDMEAGKTRREREVNTEWGLGGGIGGLARALLASDYERQRYINEPEKAIFGKEADGPWYNKGEAVSDVLYGTSGAVADMFPGLGAFAGPAIRGARDAQHVITDSKYQKSGADIGADITKDVMVTGPIALLPNFRRAKRMMVNLPGSSGIQKNIALNDARAAVNAGAAPDAIKETINLFDDIPKRKLMVWKEVDALPDSYLKSQLQGELAKVEPDWDAVRKYLDAATFDVAHSANTEMNKANAAMTESIILGGDPKVHHIQELPQYGPLTRQMLNTPMLSPLEAKALPVYDAVSKALGNELGSRGLKASATLTGRGSNKPSKVETKAERDELERIKKEEARFWKAGFIPNKAPGDPLWEAYSEWDAKRKANE